MRFMACHLLIAALSFSPPSMAAPVEGVVGANSIAQRMVSLSIRSEVEASDPRVRRAEMQMAKAMKNTGETEQAVAAACTRAARFIFDATKAPATSLDVLDALAERGAGRPMSDTVGRYVEARRNSAGKTHAEAMAALK